MKRIEELLAANPLRHSHLIGPEWQQWAQTFEAMWTVAVETTNDSEEEWAYRKLKEAYCVLMADPPIDPRHGLPTGFWEAMNWMAELRTARENL
jgi:hypothetical protein